ncbi:hypothetical protein JBE04_31620 [Streptomyces sp. PRKS01-29]|nr:hypothetical protein [Streptomyces sabulosicollis]MBI0298884.1 hypothetical protein [Streptomyces sabulosicollis]
MSYGEHSRVRPHRYGLTGNRIDNGNDNVIDIGRIDIDIGIDIGIGHVIVIHIGCEPFAGESGISLSAMRLSGAGIPAPGKSGDPFP